MILRPSVLALLVSSALTLLMVAGASRFALRIVRRWDIGSGTEEQLSLERRTYLVSTLLSAAFVVQVFSFFLFVQTADALAGSLVGAMCAAGTLNANAWGYPALFLQVATFLLSGLWLILNTLDNRAEDYPLARTKYALLLAMTPIVAAAALAQGAFLLSLRPDVITSCCGTIFSGGQRTLSSSLAGLPVPFMRVAFFATIAATVAAGVRFLARRRGAIAFAALSAASLAVGAVSLVVFVGVYIYELPTHRCPFCMLQWGYGCIGYPIYAALLGGGLLGVGAGIVTPAARIPGLAAEVPRMQRSLVAAATILWTLLAAIVAWKMSATDFTI